MSVRWVWITREEVTFLNPLSLSNEPARRLAALGLVLPAPPAPAANYVPTRRVGQYIYVAGQLPFTNGRLALTGILGDCVSLEQGQQQCQIAALNALAAGVEVIGSMSELTVIHIMVFVASVPTFYEQHLVANGASDLFRAVLGDSGVHSRSAVATPCLPLNAPVEVQALFGVRP